MPKRSNQKYVENYKRFEAEESTSLIDDLRMSDDSEGKTDEKDENDDGDGIGRNKVSPRSMLTLDDSRRETRTLKES